MATVEKVNLAQKFSLFHELWTPKVIGEVNGQHMKLARIKGEFVWHAHEDADELFLLVEGSLKILIPDGEVVLSPGELVVIPKGMQHKPVAEEEALIMMIEPVGTVNTGDAPGERTVAELEYI